MALDDSYTPPYYTFPGINIKFNKDVVLPQDLTNIKLYDEERNEVIITSIDTTMVLSEIEIYSANIQPGKTYNLVIAPNIIKDLKGNFYDKEINISFEYKVPITRGELADFIASNYELGIEYPDVNVSDIYDHEHKDSIIEILKAGILYPYSDETFKPYRKVQRAEFATTIVRLMESQNTDLSSLNTLSEKIAKYNNKHK